MVPPWKPTAPVRPPPLQFSNVRLNMRARLVSSQALAAIYGTDEAQNLHRIGSNRCHGSFSHSVRYAPNISLHWHQTEQRDETFTLGHLAVLSQGCAAGETMDFFHGLMKINS